MKIEKLQKVLWALLVGSAVTIGCVAEAAIDTGKLPLQTYVAKRVYCGNNPGATSNSYWIDANRDLVTIKQYSGEWAYGTYPNSKGKPVTRWFRMSDVLGNINFSNYETNMKQRQAVYRTESSGQTIGTVFNDENVVVVYEGGSRTQIIYRLSNNKGYKMGWVPNSSINKKASYSSEQYRQQQPTGIPTNPIINNNISRPTNNTIDDIVPSTNPVGYQQWQGMANKKATVYDDSGLKVRKGVEWVGKGDVVTVLDEAGNAYWIEYEGKYRGKPTMKKRWVHKSVINPYTVTDNNFVTSDATLDNLMNQWVGKTWTNYSYRKGVKECKEFASYIFDQLFDVGYIGTGNTSSNLTNYKVNLLTNKVALRAVDENLDIDGVKYLFSSAKPGDFVQMRRSTKTPHSAIFVGKDDNGVWFFEANASVTSGYNGIEKNYWTYDELVNGRTNSKGKVAWKNVAMSVYYAK